MQADFLFAVNFCINGLCAVHTASEVIDMKILVFTGGLGNQIFGYAFYCWIKDKFPQQNFYGIYNHKK